MKTNKLSILFTITTATLAQGENSARLDRVERDISELSFLVRQLSAKVEKGFSTQPKPEIPQGPSAATHLVRTGDTYWGIARKYGVTVRSLCNANPRVSARKLPIGKRINLPGSLAAAPANSRGTSSQSTYSVRKGDTLGHIAQRHSIPLKELVSNNPGINPKRMQIGHELHIPSRAVPVLTPKESPVESTPAPRLFEELPPLPEIPSPPPIKAPDPEIPPIAMEEGTPSSDLTEAPAKKQDSPAPEIELLSPDATDLVVIDENSRMTDIANRYLTDVATLNKLNNVELAPDQMIKSGSQLYIPRD
jgi:LysM repeat protein